ncbi:MAG: GNAT family N-acetyltransferase [Synergistaceae bacterium]|nr:GNAT family N-acetyltransferase [Synergistaceae bacterium]
MSIDAASDYAWHSDLLYYELFKRETSTSIGAYSLFDNKLAGYGILDLGKSDSFILKLIVAEEHRRKGIGSQILLALSEAAQAYGFNRISLRVRLNNAPAISFYMMFGFMEDEVVSDYYHDGVSALLMSASLPLYLPGDDLYSY